MRNIKILAIILVVYLAGAYAKAEEYRDANGLTKLHLAAGAGNTSLVDSLIQSGADVLALDSTMGVSVLHKAVYSGNAETVELLLKHAALIDLQSPSNGDTPLHDAIYFKIGKNLSVIKTLLRFGASLSIKNRAGLTPFESAQVLGDRESEKLLREEEAKRYSEIGKSLMVAVRENDIVKVKAILNKPKIPIEERDEQGFTPLLWASRVGEVEVTKLLLDHGANPNTFDRWMGANAGHKAAFWGRAEVMQLLTKHGLDVNAQGAYNGYTPLHDAVSQNHIDVVKILLNASAKTDIRGHDNKTPLDIARQANRKELVDLLLGKKVE